MLIYGLAKMETRAEKGKKWLRVTNHCGKEHKNLTKKKAYTITNENFLFPGIAQLSKA